MVSEFQKINQENHYMDLAHICIVCGFPVLNATNYRQKMCQLPFGQQGPRKRSTCQAFRENTLTSVARKFRRDTGTMRDSENPVRPKPVFVEKKRRCLGPRHSEEEPYYFLSKGIGNRQCEACLSCEPGMDMPVHLRQVKAPPPAFRDGTR